MENGDTPWKKMIGDYLLQRLGVPTEYFEVMAFPKKMVRLTQQDSFTQRGVIREMHIIVWR